MRIPKQPPVSAKSMRPLISDHFLQKSHKVYASFAETTYKDKTSYGSSPPCKYMRPLIPDLMAPNLTDLMAPDLTDLMAQTKARSTNQTMDGTVEFQPLSCLSCQKKTYKLNNRRDMGSKPHHQKAPGMVSVGCGLQSSFVGVSRGYERPPPRAQLAP